MCSQLGEHFGQLERAPRSKVIHDAGQCYQTKEYFTQQKTHKDSQTGGVLFCSRWNLKPVT